MRVSQGRLRLSAWLITALLCFIWGNSLLPGSVSGAFSDWVKEILARILPGEVPGVTSGGGLLRKLAHFSEFAALGAALCWRFGLKKRKKILALIGGFGTACMDETIQRFVPDRGPSLRDVAIDTCGVTVGILLLLLTHKLVKNYRILKEKKTL